MNISSRQLAALLLLLPFSAFSANLIKDPLMTRKTVSATQTVGMLDKKGAGACNFDAKQKLLTITDVVERALCNNPETQIAWANVKIQAAQLGVGRSAYLPTIAATVPLSWSNTDTEQTTASNVPISANTRRYSPSMAFNYLLFSFDRGPTAENLRQKLKAANWTQNSVLQNVALSAVTSYYQLFSAKEAVEANIQAEKYSLENLKAATTRYEVGVTTLADKLQAETAYSQATLNRVRSEGNLRIAQGGLANIMGVEAGVSFDIAPPAAQKPDDKGEKALELLIAEAKTARPDLLAAEAAVKAARANVTAEKGKRLPNVSLLGSYSNFHSERETDYRNHAVGVTVNIPLFTGFNTHYTIQTAKATLENITAQRDRLKNQVTLDVWESYYNLKTEKEALSASSDLLASATESQKVAAGRYKAGVGSILELLNAEVALANARLSHIQAAYNWRIARVQLAQALGKLDMEAVSH